MRHDKVKAMLEAHGAIVENVSPWPVSKRDWRATLNGHVLTWTMDSWSHRITDVFYRAPRMPPGTSQTYLLKRFGERCGNGTIVRRYVATAAGWSAVVNGVALHYGPDESHPKLAPVLRAFQAGWHGPEASCRTPEALAMGAEAAAGRCPPEALLDWLQEHGGLDLSGLESPRGRPIIEVLMDPD